MISFKEKFAQSWPEWLVFASFIGLALFSIIIPLTIDASSATKYNPMFNALLSIGTSGIVAFIFYYVVNSRIDNRKKKIVKKNALKHYKFAKESIALAIIHASQKGGRKDIKPDTKTINKMLSTEGFKELFRDGRYANEGFYAFQNQMDERTYEYDEIIFNLKIIRRSINRLIDNDLFYESGSYNIFVNLDALLSRIESREPGYDESKMLCKFIYQLFSGFNMVSGNTGYDSIQRGIETA